VRQFPQKATSAPELVAHHYTEAGLSRKAIPYWQRAGQREIERSANIEAMQHLTQGLVLVRALPNTPERIHQELSLQTALGLALVMTKGLGAPEVRATYDHARNLCELVGDTPEVFPVLYGLCNFYIQQEDMKTAQELAAQMLIVAEGHRDIQLRIAAHRVLVSTCFWRGAFIEANDHCQKLLDLYDPQRHRSLAALYGTDPTVACLGIGAWALWYLGYPDQARTCCNQCLALARDLAHPYTLAMALVTMAWTHIYLRDETRAIELVEDGISLAAAHEFPHWHAMGIWMRGLARSKLGEAEGAP
jgi:predicted ATPase